MNIEERNSNPNSSYNMILGPVIGAMMSQAHSAAIGSGYELERILEELTDKPVQFTTKVATSGGKNIIPDLLYDTGRIVHIGEIKLGTTFDTKKSQAEIDNLLKLKKHFEKKGRKVKLHFISWLAKDHETIESGLKGKLHAAINPMTGQELAEWLGFEKTTVTRRLNKHKRANQQYMFEALGKELGYAITG